MTDVSQLGGGYADSLPHPEPTVRVWKEAVRIPTDRSLTAVIQLVLDLLE